ncbi:DUF1934 domain-containing protein [Paenibacillus marinisediminis]
MSETRSNPLSDKCRVRITVISRQQDERVEQAAEGDLYVKGSSFYLRYTEQVQDPNHVKRRSGSQMENSAPVQETAVMLKISADEWKLTRSGSVRSEMSFAQGAARSGRYESKVLSFPLETRTRMMRREDETFQMDNGETCSIPAKLRWSYELFVDGRSTGRFDIQIRLQPITGESL